MSGKIKKLNMDDYVAALSKTLVQDVFTRIREEDDKWGNGVGKELALNFIASAVGTIMYTALCQKPNKELKKAEMENFVVENFADWKFKMQEAVAAGFSGALTTFNKKPAEYYCTVRLIPETLSKTPH